MEQKLKHLVRIINTDIPGGKSALFGLRKIKGVGYMYANMALTVAKIDAMRKLGSLSDEEVKRLDDVLRNPKKYDVPAWLFNRRRDFETGEDKHILTSDIDFFRSNDIKLMKKIKCYKGIRHATNHPVRGQRTRSNFRKSKSRGGAGLGVVRKAVQAKAAPKEEKKKGKE